jgi:hypothetical protein
MCNRLLMLLLLLFGRKESWSIRGTIREFSWRGWEKSRKTSGRLVSVSAEIPTQNLANTSLKSCCWKDLLDLSVIKTIDIRWVLLETKHGNGWELQLSQKHFQTYSYVSSELSDTVEWPKSPAPFTTLWTLQIVGYQVQALLGTLILQLVQTVLRNTALTSSRWRTQRIGARIAQWKTGGILQESGIAALSSYRNRSVDIETEIYWDKNVAIFWDISQCSPYLKQRFEGTYNLDLQGSHLLYAFLLGWFSTLKMEVIRSSETKVHIWTTQRYISQTMATFITTAVRTSDPSS